MAQISDEQKNRLVQLISSHYEDLYGNSSNTRKHKSEIWNEIKKQLSVLGPEKTVDQWKKCWTTLSKTASRKVLLIEQYLKRTKGKRNCPTRLDVLDKLVLKVVNDQGGSSENNRSPSLSAEQVQFQSLNGVTETSHKSSFALRNGTMSHSKRDLTNEEPSTSLFRRPVCSVANDRGESSENRRSQFMSSNQVQSIVSPNVVTLNSQQSSSMRNGTMSHSRQDLNSLFRGRNHTVVEGNNEYSSDGVHLGSRCQSDCNRHRNDVERFRSDHRSRSHRDTFHSTHRHRQHQSSSDRYHRCVTRHSSGQCRKCFLSQSRNRISSEHHETSTEKNVEHVPMALNAKLEDIFNTVQICLEEVRDLRAYIESKA